jgi:beta-ureidopropionase / N-carbamoyl-L-amino-acid hydrolase
MIMSATIETSPDIEWLLDPNSIFAELRDLTADTVGVTRSSYGAGESAGLDFIQRISLAHGLEVQRDPAANLVVTLQGKLTNAPAIVIGSHMDSVPRGGNYDGAAGIIAGLLCLLRFKALKQIPPRTIKLICFRGEESAWFNAGCLGSRALLGDLTKSNLELVHQESGRSLKAHLKDLNAAIELIEAQRPLMNVADIAAYYELHIEQGPVMVSSDLPVAVVTGIRGIFRLSSIKCVGEEGHSGAVPKELRRDAVSATVDLLNRMDEHWTAFCKRGDDLVITTGVLSTDPAVHGAARISGEVTFSFDARSQSEATLEKIKTIFFDEARNVAAQRYVEFLYGAEFAMRPSKMDPKLRNHLIDTARRIGIPVGELPSGPGHDATTFCQHGVPTAMIFIRNQNGSHNPHESMEIADFMLGANLLFHAIGEEPP